MRLRHLRKRRGYWKYIRRVPDRARPVDPRKWINKTTGIRIADDPRGISAGARAAQLETLLITQWEDRLAGRAPAPAIAFARNVDIAKRFAVAYLAHDEVRQLPGSSMLKSWAALGFGGPRREASMSRSISKRVLLSH